MDFEDINQSTVTSMADLIPVDSSTEKAYDQNYSTGKATDLQNIEVKIHPDDKNQLPVFATQFSSLSTTSKDTPKEKPSILATEWKMILFISILFTVMVTGIALIYHFYKQVEYEFELGKTIHLDEISRELDVYNENKEKVLSGIVGKTLPPGLIPYNCLPLDDDIKDWDKNRTCVAWKDKAKLQVEYTSNAPHVNCYQFTWKSFDTAYYPYDCFYLDGFWYGGLLANTAPFHEQVIERQPFLTSSRNGANKIGSVVEPYWLMSKNLAIIVEGDFPLHFSVNALDSTNKSDGQFCLMSQYDNSPYHNTKQKLPELVYSICTGSNMLDVHKYMLSTYYQPADRNPPDVKQFQTPIYTTWAKFKQHITQDKVLSYVNSLADNNYVKGTVVCQEGWQSKHGDLEFDTGSFPNASGMVSDIRSKGYEVGITITHMVATDSNKFQQGVSEDFLVKDAGNAAPGLVQYWTGPHTEQYYGGYTAALDFFVDSYTPLKPSINSIKVNYMINYLSFEGGQSDLLPYHSSFRDDAAGPNLYVNSYATFASSSVQWCPVQAVYKCQYCSVFLQFYDFNSTDNRKENGLESVLPSVISAGLMGYPFIIPGAIGGADYAGKPSKTLYIRWMQLNTFLPVLHFSIPPEDYDQQTIDIVKQLTSLHIDYVVPEIQRVADDASNSLYSIIRPLWWYDPMDSKCLETHDEFMVGERILVAPILDETLQKRDIYLPKGRWIDKNKQTTHDGPEIITDYEASLAVIPYYELQV